MGQGKVKLAHLTFYFRDLFLGLFLHHLLLELDLCHLGHLLSLCQKHRFEQQEEDHETEVLQYSQVTYDGSLPLSFRFLFHNSLGLSCDQQTSLLCFPGCRTRNFWYILFPRVLTLSLTDLQDIKHMKVCFHTYMSSKFLLMDSGIFGFVTRTAFISVDAAKKENECKKAKLTG